MMTTRGRNITYKPFRQDQPIRTSDWLTLWPCLSVCVGVFVHAYVYECLNVKHLCKQEKKNVSTHCKHVKLFLWLK